MNFAIIFGVIISIIDQIGSSNLPTVCTICSSFPPSIKSAELLHSFCQNGNITDNRCCVIDGVAVGVDLSNCHLHSLSVIPSDEKFNIQWLAVNGNDNLTDEFSGLRSLQNLSTYVISIDGSCGKAFYKSQFDESVLICEDPSHSCPDGYCPKNSHCLQDGPGLSMCLCDEGWNSYRCLKKDGFPMVQWLSGFAISTIVICVSLRLLQRKGRKAGKAFIEFRDNDTDQRPLNSPSESE